jgi:FecR protein/Putative zinc-finger
MSDKLESLLSRIRNEQIDDKVVAQAGERVWSAIAGSPAANAGAQTLRSCEDFQRLIPAYVGKQMTPGRALLFEDHVHACVECRHALEHARAGESQRVWQFERKRSRGRLVLRFAFGVAAVAAVTFAVLSWHNGFLPVQHPVRGAVQAVDGSLYAINGAETRLIPAGYEIRNGDEIRTAKGSTAMVRLFDGSLVEMDERSDVSLSRGWKGTTIRLDQGKVIVQAAKQRTGHLFVATDDGLVSVKGTIFSVNRGTKGSRVAVIEGVVHVDYGDTSSDLQAGQEATSSPSVSKVPIQNDIAWSRNAAKYLALLGDFAILQKQFAAIPSPSLRYSSDLLPYVPEHTVIYAAIPNLANTLGEASRLFEGRLQQSPELRDWWAQQQKGSGPKLQDVLNQFKTFSSYLGDEIVFAVSKENANYSPAMVLARVRQDGLEDFLQKENLQLRSNSAETALQVVHNPWAISPTAGHPLFVYVDKNLLIASPNVAELQQTAQRVQQGGGSFAGTLFYQQIANSYQQGVEWLFSADMEQIVAHNVQVNNESSVPPGIGDVRYLTMEHRDVAGKTESHADLTFASERQGVASWLAAPAAMGSLEFVSPDASMVTSAVIKNPKSIMEEIFQMIGSNDPNFTNGLNEFETKSGVNVLNDVAAPLGGEVTMAFDGPMVPTPRWKLIFEVYDPTTLQSTISKLVDAFDRDSNNHGCSMQLSQRQVGSQTYYAISTTNPNKPNQSSSDIYYTFVDSYLIAAPDVATISQAIQTRESGNTLTHSSTFQALLPTDGYTNFSGIFYHNIGPVVAPVAQQVRSSGVLTAQQRQAIDALVANSAPGMIYAYGEPNQIVVASNTGFMGFDLGTLLTMGHNGPFLPQMFLGQSLRATPAPTQ